MLTCCKHSVAGTLTGDRENNAMNGLALKRSLILDFSTREDMTSFYSLVMFMKFL